MTNEITKRGFSTEEAAVYTGVAPETLKQARLYGPRAGYIQSPPFVRTGRKILYLREDLDIWLASQRVSPGAA